MNAFGELRAAQLRLHVLQVLAAYEGGGMNDSVLRMHLDRIGPEASIEAVRDALAWLSQPGRGAVRCAPIPGTEIVKSWITAYGDDLARGRTGCPGVLRPDPE